MEKKPVSVTAPITFAQLPLSNELLKGIDELGFSKPTLIQEKMIPIFFENNNDLIAMAQTGTGKTAAFGLPIIMKVDTENPAVQSLILSPTRELCLQIANDLKNYSKYINKINIVPVYGGVGIDQQIRSLKKKAHIIVATPGRMLDILNRKATNISQVQFLVLDEADEILNMGFREELNAILEKTPSTKRTLLFSATMPRDVSRITKNYMEDPIVITAGIQNSGSENIHHVYYLVSSSNRYLALKRILDIHPDIYGIVFCRTKVETQKIADYLMKDGYNAEALHGDLSQNQRTLVMNRFRERSLQILVATDVAARGIDVRNITHIINYNLPDELETYTHRSGRTGRANQLGVSISLISHSERNKINQIGKNLKKKFEKKDIPSGEEICQIQLLKLIDRVEKVKVEEAQIDSFMKTVYDKLKNLDKEQIIKNFISLEFNRFLEYYKDAPDLNQNVFSERNENPRRRRSSFPSSRNFSRPSSKPKQFENAKPSKTSSKENGKSNFKNKNSRFKKESFGNSSHKRKR